MVADRRLLISDPEPETARQRTPVGIRTTRQTTGSRVREHSVRGASGSRALWGVLLLYVLTASAWAWLNPVFEAPDEPFHVAYANLLVREHRWPLQSDIWPTIDFMERHADPSQDFRIFEAGQSAISVQWSQTPLYYIVQALPLSFVYPRGFHGILIPVRPNYRTHAERGYFQHDPAEHWNWRRELVAIRLMRLMSVFLGGLTVWWTARLARLVAPNAAALPVLAAAVLAFAPQFTFMTASVNNDVAGYLATTMALWVMVRTAQGRWSPLGAAGAIGLCLGLGLLAKPTTMFLWPLTFIVTLRFYQRWTDRAVCAGGAIALGLAIAWPFFAERIGLHMDLLGFVLLGRQSEWFTFKTGFLGWVQEPSWRYVGNVLAMLGESLWGQFGWFQVKIDKIALTAYWLLVGIALVGWGRGTSSGLWRVDRRSLTVLHAAILTFLVGVVCLYTHIFIPQGGRYLLVVGSAMAILMAVGLLRAHRVVVARWSWQISEWGWTWAVVGILVCLNWVVLWRSIYQPYVKAWAG